MADKKSSSSVTLSLNNQADIQVKLDKKNSEYRVKENKNNINKYLYDIDSFALLSSN